MLPFLIVLAHIIFLNSWVLRLDGRRSYKDGLLGELGLPEALDFIPVSFQVVNQLGRTSYALE